MFIKQLSVFLENRCGRLTEITEALGNAGVNLAALSIAETSEFGIIRMVVSDSEKGLEVLKEKNFSVSLTDVICLSTPNEAGTLAKSLRILANEGISIEYMYAFSMGERALVVIRTEDLEETVDVLKEHDRELLKPEELYNI
ncbi:acetolactate synthase [Natroniella sulfidigena]|uniref:ACT domain-containing protein n=1 Tax=Natroniella sulfidigena TaxID=723921 RepID=UPI00200AA8FD|nr:ACT domain-containing protein [Natroniella sulfidigena]MCK8817906.1 acetolactate synthase [Natroniella sulfidigena]